MCFLKTTSCLVLANPQSGLSGARRTVGDTCLGLRAVALCCQPNRKLLWYGLLGTRLCFGALHFVPNILLYMWCMLGGKSSSSLHLI